MEMFWLKRLKGHESRWQWALPYGDLMSLLLAVFVMIAAMSELRAGGRFEDVAGGVRSAFGFSGVDRASSLDGLVLGKDLKHLLLSIASGLSHYEVTCPQIRADLSQAEAEGRFDQSACVLRKHPFSQRHRELRSGA